MNNSVKNRPSKMELIVRVVLSVLLIWMGVTILRINYQPIWMGEMGIYKYLKYLLFFVLLVIMLVVDGVSFSRNKVMLHLLPTFMGTTLLVLIVVRLFSINSFENEKVIFKVHTLETAKGAIAIEFKEGGVFKFIEPSKSGPTCAYGTYHMKDSVIEVNDFEFPGYFFHDKWIFRNDTLFLGDLKMIRVLEK